MGVDVIPTRLFIKEAEIKILLKNFKYIPLNKRCNYVRNRTPGSSKVNNSNLYNSSLDVKNLKKPVKTVSMHRNHNKHCIKIMS